MARLIKTPPAGSSSLRFRWVQLPLDYELFVWTLWFGEHIGADQFLLSNLLEELTAQISTTLGPGRVDWNVYAHRQSLKRALAALEEMGALRRLDGSTEAWASDNQGNTLYEFCALAGSLVSSGDSVPQDAQQRLYRSLLLLPAVYPQDDPEAFALLQGRDRRRSIAQNIHDRFGWELEVAPTYAALLRPSASEVSESLLFPFRGALMHVVLLLCRLWRDRGPARDASDRFFLSEARLQADLVEARKRWGVQWGSTLSQVSSERLLEETAAVMKEWRMLSGPDQDRVYTVMPLAGRFTGAYREA
jgi:hypothetical protein